MPSSTPHLHPRPHLMHPHTFIHGCAGPHHCLHLCPLALALAHAWYFLHCPSAPVHAHTCLCIPTPSNIHACTLVHGRVPCSVPAHTLHMPTPCSHPHASLALTWPLSILGCACPHM